MKDYLQFGDRPITDFGFYVSDADKFAAPERIIETAKVPGRNGELTFEDGSYSNINVKYVIYGSTDLKTNLAGLRSYLNIQGGYRRLEDTLNTDEYRMARFVSEFEVKKSDKKNAYLELTFDCMPQRFLKSGEKSRAFNQSGSIRNEWMPAKPLIRAYGTGSITIGSRTLTITSADGYTDIDCELMDAYKGETNCNGNISGEFPILENGINAITLSGLTIEITPRWWKL